MVVMVLVAPAAAAVLVAAVVLAVAVAVGWVAVGWVAVACLPRCSKPMSMSARWGAVVFVQRTAVALQFA